MSFAPLVAQLLSTVTNNQLLLLMAISFLFACQFNHSRFALVIALFAILFAVDQKLLSMPAWLTITDEIKSLTVLSFFGAIAFIQDRSLLSVHLFSRIALLVGAYLFVILWLEGIALLTPEMQQHAWFGVIKPYLAIELPLIITSVILLVRSLLSSHLLYPALLASAAVWYVHLINLVSLNWQVILTVLMVYYLGSVIASSYFLAYRDELTGLPSRRALNQTALSLGRKYCVAMMDVDHFKKFNDTYGHDIGDQVLKLVATKLNQVRGGGRVFRYGGEEFTVVFARKNAQQVFDELDKLRQSIADYQMVIRQGERKTKKDRQGKKGPKSTEKTVSVTISIGASDRQKGQSFEEVLKAADQLLYKAKKRGRNNVTI